MAYLTMARCDNNVVYAEIFFDPQHHKIINNMSFEICADGILSAMNDAQNRHAIQSKLIPCFLRDQTEASALDTWLEMSQYFLSHPTSKGQIIGVGLDSSEKNHPPHDFHRVFWFVRHAPYNSHGLGMHVVAHAGEEGPPDYIVQALDILHAERIDHGSTMFGRYGINSSITE